MDRSTLATAAVVTFLFVAPIASAKWMAFGTYEPDTIYDTSVYMVQDGPGSARNATLYFNAYHKNLCAVKGTPPPPFFTLNPGTGATGCWINPNSGALETHNDPGSPLTATGAPVGQDRSWQVIMGIWTDCNGDGYVGLAETGAFEYHARVLTTPLSSVGTSRCEPKTGSITGYAAAGMPNNYNNWVTEFLAIGGVDYDSQGDHRVFFDRNAMVWAEPGVPDAPIGAPPPSVACKPSVRGPANAQEEGDFHSAGGALWQIDCQGNRRVGATDALGPGGAIPAQPGVPFSFVKTFNQTDAAAGAGLGFGNDPKHSTSPLNVKVGSENADNGGVIVKAQDCGSGHYGPGENSQGEEPETLNTRTLGLPPQAQEINDLTLLRPVPANPVNTNPSTWSVPATLNYTYESAPERPGTGGGPITEGDCNFDNDPGYDFYGGNAGGLILGTPPLEGNPIVGQQGGKVTATTNLRFITSQRGSLPGTAVSGGAGGGDPNMGIPLVAGDCAASSCEITQWLTGAALTPQGRGPIVRTDTNNVENNGLPSAAYVTFYGYVGATTKGRSWTFPNAAEKYGNGDNSCDGATSGTVNNWQCDSTKWYKTADGADATAAPLWCTKRPCQGFGVADISVPLARVHQEYTFRDVDCLDGRLGNTGVGTAPTFFGGPCLRPDPAEE